MKHFCEFKPSGDSFEARDHPSTLCSALGRAALSYADLEGRVDATIHRLSETRALTADELSEWSLLRKLRRMGTLLAAAQHVRFNVGDLDEAEVRAELIQVLTTADELYRETITDRGHRLIRSHLWRNYPDEVVAQLMDVADYVSYADSALEEFFMVAEPVM